MKVLSWYGARTFVEIERETDGRWIADIPSVPGAMAYGKTPKEAVTKALNIAKETNAS